MVSSIGKDRQNYSMQVHCYTCMYAEDLYHLTLWLIKELYHSMFMVVYIWLHKGSTHISMNKKMWGCPLYLLSSLLATCTCTFARDARFHSLNLATSTLICISTS